MDKITTAGEVPAIALRERLAQLEKAGRVNLRRKVSTPPFIIKVDGVGTIPRKDLFAIKAKSKQGKSQAATVLLSGVLGDESLGITISEPYKTRAIYFDTEQASYNTIMVGHRVHHLLGWKEESNNARFRAYNMREWNWEDKMPFIEYVISSFKPTLVIIDGIADLLLNFNDVEKSAVCILNLMQIASKFGCAVGCVLHENKSKDDNNMKGHLGTLLLQKASDIFEITKKNNVFCMCQTETRNKPIGDIKWIMDDEGNIKRQDKEPQQIKIEAKESKASIWRQIFAKLNVTESTYIELAKTYAEVCNCSIATGKRRLSDAEKEGIIVKNSKGTYSL